MQVIRGFSQASHDRIALTIGNFDGVHRGHQAMLARLSEAAEDLELPPPHASVLGGGAGVPVAAIQAQVGRSGRRPRQI